MCFANKAVLLGKSKIAFFVTARAQYSYRLRGIKLNPHQSVTSLRLGRRYKFSANQRPGASNAKMKLKISRGLLGKSQGSRNLVTYCILASGVIMGVKIPLVDTKQP